MRALSVILALFLASFKAAGIAAALPSPSDGLRPFADAIAHKTVSLRYSFNVEDGAASSAGEGTLVYRDGAYALSCGNLLFCNDGSSQWTVDFSAAEAVVDNAQRVDFLSDESALLSLFNVRDPLLVQVSYVPGTSLVRKIDIRLRGGGDIILNVSDICLQEEEVEGQFSFDPASFPQQEDWFVTDLRQVK